jgi:predicted nuclease of predicted toxin-antitoxin system
MKFKTDENLPEEAAELLRSAGYDASTILEQSMGGELDPEVASVCRREQRTLVTLDLGFADIRTYPPEEYHGLIVLRLRRQDKAHVVGVIEQLLPILETEPLADRLWIVEEERVRIRS